MRGKLPLRRGACNICFICMPFEKVFHFPHTAAGTADCRERDIGV
jgi:hypothetical protein